MDEGVIAHVRGDEGFSYKVSKPITEIVVTSRDEAALLAIQGRKNEKLGVAAVVVRW